MNSSYNKVYGALILFYKIFISFYIKYILVREFRICSKLLHSISLIFDVGSLAFLEYLA